MTMVKVKLIELAKEITEYVEKSRRILKLLKSKGPIFFECGQTFEWKVKIGDNVKIANPDEEESPCVEIIRDSNGNVRVEETPRGDDGAIGKEDRDSD